MTRRDVVIVGGGVVGSATAWRLARRGVDVVLLERFEAEHVRGSSHGASRGFRLAHPRAGYVRLAQHAFALWRQLEGECGQELLTTTGGVDHGDAAALRAVASALSSRRVPYAVLPAAQARYRWPGLRFESPVLYQPDAGRLHADRCVAALRRLAVERGAEVRYRTPVRHVGVDGDDRAVVRTDAEVIRARRVVVTAGPWVPDLIGGVVRLPDLVVTQDQPAHFAPADDSAAWPSFLHHVGTGEPSGGARAAYGLLTPGEGLKVGLARGGVRADPDLRTFLPDARLATELRDYVRGWVPGVEATSGRHLSCVSTSTPANDFVLDRAGPIVVGSACSGRGFTFAPAAAEVLADLATGSARTPPRFRLPYARSPLASHIADEAFKTY
ncbi:FAD-dependent oxidoreductase [Jiangella endophytica]|uniref:FAD-dependent oxidoreductase n=1 Tax=Jiangella endophytica TaxID=1623398 RepID=UPI000E34C9EC|nr:FAD-dependent oxidoreductase [Jiangella endophytica]